MLTWLGWRASNDSTSLHFCNSQLSHCFLCPADGLPTSLAFLTCLCLQLCRQPYMVFCCCTCASSQWCHKEHAVRVCGQAGSGMMCKELLDMCACVVHVTLMTACHMACCCLLPGKPGVPQACQYWWPDDIIILFSSVFCSRQLWWYRWSECLAAI